MPTPTYDLIESVTVAESTSSVIFSSIPQDYRDLVLVVNYKSDNNPDMYTFLRLNDDQTLSYNEVYAEATGISSGITSGRRTNKTTLRGNAGASTTVPALVIWQFMDYSASDKHTTVLWRGNTTNTVVDANYVSMSAGRYGSTTVISRIDYGFFFDTAAIGTTLNLYGIAA